MGVTGNGQSKCCKNTYQGTTLLAASAKFENRSGEWERVLDQIEHLKITWKIMILFFFVLFLSFFNNFKNLSKK